MHNVTRFSPVTHYLTPNENEAFHLFSSSFRDLIETRFLKASRASDIEVGQQVVQIATFISSKNLPILEASFIKLTQSVDGYDNSLQMLLNICKKGWSEALFSCLTCKKVEGYSSETIKKIIADFNKLLQNLDQNTNPLKCFLPFNEGGEEKLKELLIDSSAKALSRFREEEIVCLPEKTSATISLREFIENENSLKEIKSQAIQYLASLDKAHRLPLSLYLKILDSLENHPTKVQIPQYFRSIIIKLIVVTTTDEHAEISNIFNIHSYEELMDNIITIHKSLGYEAFKGYLSSLKNSEVISLDLLSESLHLLRSFASKENIPDEIIELLEQFSSEELNLKQIVSHLQSINPLSVTHFVEKEKILGNFGDRFRGRNEPNVSFPLNEDKLNKIFNLYARIQNYCEQWQSYSLNQLIENSANLSSDPEEKIIQLTAIGRLAMFIKFQRYLYRTQVLTVLGELSFNQGCVAQVKTGEGKSMIVMLLAFILAMQQKSVHIVSSSPSLSIRDQKECKDFFRGFGITTSHICDKMPDAGKFNA